MIIFFQIQNANNVQFPISVNETNQNPVIINIENLVIKNEDEKKKFFENLQKAGNIAGQIRHLGFQQIHVNAQDDSGEDQIQINLESSTPEISFPEKVIEKDIFIKDFKDSATEKNVEVVVKKKTWKDENNILHMTFLMKVTKWTEIKPCCRFNLIMVVIGLLLTLMVFLNLLAFLFFKKEEGNNQ